MEREKFFARFAEAFQRFEGNSTPLALERHAQGAGSGVRDPVVKLGFTVHTNAPSKPVDTATRGHDLDEAPKTVAGVEPCPIRGLPDLRHDFLFQVFLVGGWHAVSAESNDPANPILNRAYRLARSAAKCLAYRRI